MTIRSWIRDVVSRSAGPMRAVPEWTGKRKRNRSLLRPRMERLEERIMLDCDDPFYSAASAPGAVNLRLQIDNVGGIESLRLIEATQGEVAARPLSEIVNQICIVGSDFSDRLEFTISTADLLVKLPHGVEFVGAVGTDTLV